MKKESKLVSIAAGVFISSGILLSGCQGAKVYLPAIAKYNEIMDSQGNYNPTTERNEEGVFFVNGPVIMLKSEK